MCSEVNPATDPNDPNYLHGVRDNVAVTDANGNTYYVNCAAQVVVGHYIGAQMAGFDAAAVLGLIDNLQDGEQDQAYTPRTVVVGGDSPYAVNLPQGSLPDGMTLGADGVLSGTPTVSGLFTFTLEATDASNVTVSKPFTLNVVGPVGPTTTSTTTTSEPTTTSSTSTTTTSEPPTTSSSTTTVPPTQQYTLTVNRTGSGSVSSSPKGINCRNKCSRAFTVGTSITLTAKPANKHVFLGWTGDCSNSGTSPICTILMLGDRSIGANFN